VTLQGHILQRTLPLNRQLDFFLSPGQVEIEDPHPSEEKDATVTVVDLSKEEAIDCRNIKEF
jgi:hypothetical protein